MTLAKLQESVVLVVIVANKDTHARWAVIIRIATRNPRKAALQWHQFALSRRKAVLHRRKAARRHEAFVHRHEAVVHRHEAVTAHQRSVIVADDICVIQVYRNISLAHRIVARGLVIRHADFNAGRQPKKQPDAILPGNLG